MKLNIFSIDLCHGVGAEEGSKRRKGIGDANVSRKFDLSYGSLDYNASGSDPLTNFLHTPLLAPSLTSGLSIASICQSLMIRIILPADNPALAAGLNIDT